ncbi:MAG: hypothetical protein WD273_10345 [Trueperaceae bacterium]
MRRSVQQNEEQLRLPLFGPARLEHRGQPVKLRRKSLAILYYLAIEGATRRQVLADLLWEHPDSAQNLRVELYDLKKALARFGLRPFDGSKDPLTLPDTVGLDAGDSSGEPLEGLEGLSPAFQAWLEVQRAKRARRGTETFVHRDLVRETATKIRLPFVLILSGPPDSGQYPFAVSLAAALGLPITEHIDGGRPAVRFLAPSNRYDDSTADKILKDPSNLWVLERPLFGEDPNFLLRLRSDFPPDRLSYLELPALGWSELRAQLQPPLLFERAAELFTFTGGHPGFLRELLAAGGSKAPAESLTMPQRIRAAYQLEARRLTSEARFALERASVHPGALSEGLLATLEIDSHLIELERRNWLGFDQGWRFNDNVPRTIIYLSLPEGQARLYHQRAARQLDLEGNVVAAAYHRSAVEGKPDWRQIAEHTEDWAQRLAAERGGTVFEDDVPRVDATLLEEYPLLETDLFGKQVEVNSGEVLISRQPFEVAATGVELSLMPGPGVLHLRGKAHVTSSLEVGISGRAVPLQAEFLGANPRRVVFAPVGDPQTLAGGNLLVPLAGEIDCYLHFDNSLFLRLSSLAEAGVIELTLTAYRVGPPGRGEAVEAYDLTKD